MTIKDSFISCNWSYLIPAFDRMAVTGGNMAWSQGTMNAKKGVNCENIQALIIKAGNDRPKILSGKFQSPVASLQLYKENSQHSNRKQFPKHLQNLDITSQANAKRGKRFGPRLSVGNALGSSFRHFRWSNSVWETNALFLPRQKSLKNIQKWPCIQQALIPSHKGMCSMLQAQQQQFHASSWPTWIWSLRRNGMPSFASSR